MSGDAAAGRGGCLNQWPDTQVEAPHQPKPVVAGKTDVIGLFGGTFDPVHHGHLRAAVELCDLLRLDDLRLLPCHRPSHRGAPGASTPERVQMLELATRGVPGVSIDTRESQRDKPSYSVDTLQSFRDEYPQACLLFLMGEDAFNGFKRWHRWERILELAHLVVMHRPRYRLEGDAEMLYRQRQMSDLQRVVQGENEFAGRILLQPISQIDISATAIRELIANQRSIRYLVPETVREYILSKGLYRDTDPNEKQDH